MTAHIEYFQIDSFRGIKNLKLNNLKEINIITGDNNSGKTSILEIINHLNAIDSVRNIAYSTTRGIKRSQLFDFTPFQKINYLFPIDDEQSIVSYSFKTDQKHDVILKKENYFELLPESEVKKMQGYRVNNTKSIEEELVDTEYSHLEFVLDGNSIKNLTISEFERIRRDQSNFHFVNTVYITPFRHTLNDMFLSEVLNNSQLYEEMLIILKEFDENIISINVDSSGHSSANKRYVILSKNHKKAIPLELYGDGMKKAILLMSAVVSAKNGILLLDEFETAIHTSAMNKIFTWIINTCIKLNVQLFITSHSKEAIEKVLKCCPDLSNNINLYTLYKKGDNTLVRTLSCKEAIEVIDKFDLEVR